MIESRKYMACNMWFERSDTIYNDIEKKTCIK